MKKLLLGLIMGVLLFSCEEASAQIEMEKGAKPAWKERVYFGGSFGGSFGTITYFDVSPVVGYMIRRNLSGGVGITYQYYNDKSIDYTTNIYGGRVFVRQNFRFMKIPLFAYAEYENVNYEYIVQITQDGLITRREWIPGILIGGGFFQQIGKRSGFMIAVLYYVLYNERSPYNNPVVRVGFTF
ncbi:hypothetical protein ACFLU5_03875 [Bacteroidota bacterium]